MLRLHRRFEEAIVRVIVVFDLKAVTLLCKSIGRQTWLPAAAGLFPAVDPSMESMRRNLFKAD